MSARGLRVLYQGWLTKASRIDHLANSAPPLGTFFSACFRSALEATLVHITLDTRDFLRTKNKERFINKNYSILLLSKIELKKFISWEKQREYKKLVNTNTLQPPPDFASGLTPTHHRPTNPPYTLLHPPIWQSPLLYPSSIKQRLKYRPN